ncbi:MAG: thiol:disulfide interchange protein DsbA/DsbL [Pseudomonadales bacterium]|nr:thiol:disulfide interchange protein DsbA/DsbL [Pseudomonadales bacterium]
MNIFVKGLCAVAFLLFGFQLFGQQGYEQGVDYQKLVIPVQTLDESKVEVIEIFSYGCVHCYNFDSELQQWLSVQNDDVSFRRIPAVLNKSWETLAQSFYTAQILGISEKVHMPIFTAIHETGIDFKTAGQMAELFKINAGVEKSEFTSIFDSFGVRSQVQQARASGRMYRVKGVPTMVVGGKYVVDGIMAGNNTRMLDVVDFLVQQESESDQ